MLTRITKAKYSTMGSNENFSDKAVLFGNTLENVKHIWQTADAVCFDVDSTVCQDEGIDELARFVGKGNEVAALTKKAMRGGMEFQNALKIRLDVIQPSTAIIDKYIEWNTPKLTPFVKDLVQLLHQRRVPVYLISGGFSSIVHPVATLLKIPVKNTFCNKLKFYYNGEYAGFDENEPTSYSGGKGEVIHSLKYKYGYKRLVMVGDGITDLEACPPADAFIGFGGNQLREEVKRRAKWFVTDFRELIDELTKTSLET